MSGVKSLAYLRSHSDLLSRLKRNRRNMSNDVEAPKNKEPRNGIEPLWTSKQVAEYLHLSQSTVARYARERILPSVNVGPHLKRFRPESIRQFLERNTSMETATTQAIN